MTRLRLGMLALILGVMGCDSATVPRSKTPGDRAKAALVQVQLGSGYMQQGKLDLALERLTRAVELDPRSAMAHSMLGVLYEQINDPQKAELNYRKSVGLPGDTGNVANNFGQFLCRYERYGEADLQFQAALRDPFYSGRVVAATNAGICARKAGRLNEAERYLRAALSEDATYIPALLPMAEVLADQEQYLGARAFLQRHEASGAGESAAMLALGVRVETALADPRAAADYRQRLLRSFSTSPEARRFQEP